MSTCVRCGYYKRITTEGSNICCERWRNVLLEEEEGQGLFILIWLMYTIVSSARHG